ncbi:biotin--[acetyl-CoA-carboxylase] ligase [Psychromicrobium lacuslunae]|uniref:biotin--[biotin carboxyl-carrier protein] ligase n=1 Tax=Psychromicrobium lacuslunae TaxID=1618207 RepID=A0A0D4BWG1_9MICC|nr:biotin--[acetyl-CoA-carboxylase] ligase [Psychromicrobium lacuslunae]AJT40465.1 hypothetical protein UM93_00890 [Psychromicrobium lacuslunae]
MNDVVIRSRLPLEVQGLSSRLVSPRGPLQRLDWLAETASTNPLLAQYALDESASWPDLSLVTAEVQTQGRGRLDRGWQVPTGAALTLSVLLRPAELPIERFGWLSMLSALAVCQMLQQRAGLQARIKWPNDVVVIDNEGIAKKICGVLAQLVSAPGQPPAVVVGTGVNISQQAEELPTETSTSVFCSAGSTLDRNILIEEYVNSFTRLYQQFREAAGDPQRSSGEDESILHKISALMISLNQQVRAELPGGKFLTGTATGLDLSGALLITDVRGTTTAVSAADVVHLRRAQGSYA